MLDRFRKSIHPLLRKMMPGRRDFQLKIINEMPSTQGNKIFAMNHSNIHDVPIAGEAVQEHFYVLLGGQKLEILDRLFFRLNGVIYIDRKDKKLDKMIKILHAGGNLLMYPEGTWNLTPSKLMLPMNWGVIELAKRTGVPIVPLVAEYHPGCCYVKFGEAIYINEEMDKKTGIEQLEDTMATLRWDIWEQFGVEKRTDRMKEEFEEMIRYRVYEYPKFDLEYEQSVIRER